MLRILAMVSLVPIYALAQTNILLTNDISKKFTGTYCDDFAQTAAGELKPREWAESYDVYSNHIAIVSINGITNRMVLQEQKIGSETIESHNVPEAFATNFVPVKATK